VGGCGAGGPAQRHRGCGGHRRAVPASDHPLGRLEAGEGHDLLDVGRTIEADDRCLAQHRLDPAERADRVVPDGRSRPWPYVRGQTHPLADGEGRRRLLFCARRPPRLGTRGGPGNDDGRDDGHLLVVVLLLVVIIVVVLVVVIDHHLDVVGGIHLDDVVDHLRVGGLLGGRRLLRFVRGGRLCVVVVGCASGHM
jgi:hypothetical protein